MSTEWVTRHLDYDGEETWLIESHGPPDDPTPPCSPTCRHCYATQLPPDARRRLVIDELSMYPSELVNHPRLEDVVRRARELVESRENLPLKVITSGKFLTGRKLRILLRYVDQLDFHLLSTDPSERAKLTREGVREAARVLELVREAAREVDTVANVVAVPDYNLNSLPRILRNLDEWGLRKCVVIPVGVTRYNREGIRPPTSDEMRFLWEICRRMDRELDLDVVPCDSLVPLEEHLEGLDDLASQCAEALGGVDSRVGLVTGEMFGPVIEELCRATNEKLGREVLEPVIVENRYFGGNIGCAGLLTGEDVLHELERRDLDVAIVPRISVELGSFIDGVTIFEVSLHAECEIVVGPERLEDLPDVLVEIPHSVTV
ncbi:DUF512 domain-containing protein [Methanopyrus kandleri]